MIYNVDGVWDFKGTGYDEGCEFMVNFRVKSWVILRGSLCVYELKCFVLLFVWI